VISRMTRVEVGVIRKSRRPRLMNPYRDLDYSGYHKKPNLIIDNVMLCIERYIFDSSLTAKQQKAREHDMITSRTHAPRSYMT